MSERKSSITVISLLQNSLCHWKESSTFSRIKIESSFCRCSMCWIIQRRFSSIDSATRSDRIHSPRSVVFWLGHSSSKWSGGNDRWRTSRSSCGSPISNDHSCPDEFSSIETIDLQYMFDSSTGERRCCGKDSRSILRRISGQMNRHTFRSTSSLLPLLVDRFSSSMAVSWSNISNSSVSSSFTEWNVDQRIFCCVFWTNCSLILSPGLFVPKTKEKLNKISSLMHIKCLRM